jgi:hypothetical protein
MRNLLAGTLAATALTVAVSFSAPVLADAADPTVHQIYEAAQAGHLDQAQGMMDQVLRDHPKSAKAHYVQAELYAKEGKTNLARSELTQAEELEPGLPHENPRSVEALKGQLGLGARAQSQSPRVVTMNSASAAPHVPWLAILVLVLVVGVLWMMFRRRPSYSQYPATGGGVVSGGGSGGYGGPGGYGGYGPGPAGGGIGSGIAGGLASGLAVGAGVVAGEELAHHFLDGGREGNVIPPAGAAENNDWQQPSNSDMGGSDFGVNDSGSWDDSSGGGGGGGDDWS